MKTNKLAYVLSLVLILAGLVFTSSALANNDRNGEDRGNSEQAKAAHLDGSTLEVHISDNGQVLVRGAKVSAVTGNTVNASTSWGSVNLNWSVNVMSDSRIVRKFGGSGLISEISVGDFISFQGTLVNTSSSPILVNANVLKDWSIQKNVVVRTTIEGQIKSINSTTLPTNMVVTAGSKDYVVSIATDTSILNSIWLKAQLSSFKVGDKIRVYGTVNSDLTMNATVIRNTTLLR